MLTVIPLYISQKEQAVIISQFRKRAISPTNQRNSITRYGSSLPYKAKVNPIPHHLQFILQRLRDDNIIDADSITINEYHPGQGIDWHVDSSSSGPKIVVLSLLAEATMGLKGAQELDPLLTEEALEERQIILPPLSLLIMDGVERWMMYHKIYPLDAHRYSVVFRRGTPIIQP